MTQIKKYASSCTLKLFYNCQILPQIMYGLALWGGTFEKGLKRIVKLQKRAIRLITGAHRMDHCEPRQKELKILNIHDLYRLQINCLVYDCLFGNPPMEFKNIFVLKRNRTNAITRSNSSKPLDIDLVNPNNNPGPIMKSTFQIKALQFWNELPAELQESRNKNIFKKNLKTLYLSKYRSRVHCMNVFCKDSGICTTRRI